MNKQKESSFVLQGMILASASIIVRLIGLVYRIPLTNILGNDGNAFYSNAFEVYNIALLLSSYSVPLAVSKLVSIRVKQNQHTNAYRVFKTALIFTGSIGFIISLIIFTGADFLATNIMKMPMSTYALKTLAPCLFIVAVLGVIRGYFQGLGTTLPTAISQIFEQIMNAIVSIVAASYLFKMGTELMKTTDDPLIPSAYGAAGGTMGTVAGAFTALVFMSLTFFAYRKILLKKIYKEQNIQQEKYTDIVNVLFITILPVVFSSAISNINTILDQGIYNNLMLLQGYTQAEYANLWGIFSGKYKVLMNVPLGISSAMAAAFIPSISGAYVSKDLREARNKITLAIKCSMMIAIPCFMAYFIYGGEVMYLLFSDDTKEARYILLIGSLGLIFICLSTITSAVLQGFNRMMIPVYNALKALCVHICSLLVLLGVFKLNIYGVVLSDMIFAITLSSLNMKGMKKITGYKFKFGACFILPFFASVIMIVISYLGFIVMQFILSRKIAFIATIFISVLIYLLSLLKLQILKEQDLKSIPGGKKLIPFLLRIKLL